MLPIGQRIGATGGLEVRKCPRLFIGGEPVESTRSQAVGITGIHGSRWPGG
jgi:hypothetical protein